MWDRPDILNRVANALLAAAVVMAAYGATVYVVRMPVFPVREVRVVNALQHVTPAQVEAIARGEIRGTFFTLDLPAARAAFERLPWVRSVNLRRQWPDRLDVTLEEHVPYARWGENALVNAQGEVFEAAYDRKLPVFVGPPGSAKEIAIQFEYFRRTLAAVGRTPEYVQVSPRRAWQVRLDDGLTLELGRNDMESRLTRFVAVYERTVGRLGRRVDYVDLRYPNGFAVRVPELRRETVQPKRRGAA